MVAEKRQSEKWRPKLEKFDARVNFALRCTEEDVVYVHLIAKDGQFDVAPGKLDDYDLELRATPEDLMFFTNATYSTTAMFTKKNKYGERRLQLKKGGRHLLTLLKLSKLLVLE